MSRTRTLTNLIADCRRLAKMENSTFCSDADITELLNQELAELYARVGQGQGQPLIRSSTTIAVTVGTSLYPLPATFFQLQGVEATINGVTGALRAFMPLERAALTNPTAWASTSPIAYRVQGDNIEFLPATQSFTATLFYTPSCPRLANGSDTFDGWNGYEVAAICGTVALMIAMEDADPSFWELRKDKILRHIDSLIAQRDASTPERVQDVSIYADVAPDEWWA